MKNGIQKRKIRAVAILLAAFVFVLGIETAMSHSDDGYSHDATIGYTNKNWISNLPDDMLLSHMSIPGTHDTMTYHVALDPLLICNLGLTQ